MKRVFLPMLLSPLILIFFDCSRKEILTKDYEPIEWKDRKLNAIAKEEGSLNNNGFYPESSSDKVLEYQLNRNEVNERKFNPNKRNSDLISENEVEIAGAENNKLPKVNIERSERKAIKRQLKEKLKNNDSDVNVLLLVLIAILIPPVAVGIVRGWTSGAFFLNILLTLLFYLPGLIHALVVIFSSEE